MKSVITPASAGPPLVILTIRSTEDQTMLTRSQLALAMLTTGSGILGQPFVGVAAAQTAPVDIETNEGGTTTVTVPEASRSVSNCGTYSSSYKYSTKVLAFTVDVFRHANTTGACENNAVITHIYEYDNTCKKYAWGVAYFTRASYSFGPSTTPSTKSAFGKAECAVSIGGEIGGIGMEYTKQSNTRHTFEMKGTEARVTTSHWTTTP